MKPYQICIFIIVAAFLFSLLFWSAELWSDESVKIEAQKIIDFRTSDQSCDSLKTMYLDYYYKKYRSEINLKWFWEIEDKLTQSGCVDKNQLRNLEFIEICQDGGTTGCEISKLENPDLYDDFNFRIAVKNLKPVNGSET